MLNCLTRSRTVWRVHVHVCGGGSESIQGNSVCSIEGHDEDVVQVLTAVK